ncbi:3'-5' exonuclease [Paratractidigestivibacter sp.]|uniref:3'-5' exonuclease n=1 Tax=Paratractidigestivibacter sp. TaxID=2847316 RepID=UPI002AC95465|nr:3'-5' exonuclease [Paratractidigestivibacter sp.]
MSNTYDCDIIIDLEFTCVPKRERTLGLANEIIEVGAVKLAADGRELGRFSCLVKPREATHVIGPVRRLTGIDDNDLVDARPLEEVVEQLVAWIGAGRARMVAWSGTDEWQLKTECAAKGIDLSALPRRWLDIQRIYPRLMGTSGRAVRLSEAADWCGISLDNKHAHRGLDDALVTAEIFRMMATGECAAQRAVLDSGIRSGQKDGCASSIASRCGGDLAALLASLRAAKAAAA